MIASERLDHVSEESIRQLVDCFYAKVRADVELAPVFDAAIRGEWQPHLDKMCAFWSSVILTSGQYKGNPVVKHLVLSGMQPRLFERWLELFDRTCRELFDGVTSDAIRAKADRIAESLQLAIFYRPGTPWPRAPEQSS